MPTSPSPLAPPAAPPTLSAQTRADGTRVVALAGRLDAAGVSALWQSAHRDAAGSGALLIDASSVQYCDGAGIALLVDLLRTRPNGQSSVQGLEARYQSLFEQFNPARVVAPPLPAAPAESLVASVGRYAQSILDALVAQIAFLGEVGVALVSVLRHPRSVRWRDTIVLAERVGIGALPIVILIAFLMGVILAFQSAIPLRQYGGEIFVADLVGLSMLRELGPLMTAILLAGRTGAAFAAEIGTMKVSDEVSALTTMGLDPVRFLVVPRILAALLATPLLTIFADMAGLIGGALTMLAFSIPTTTYFNELSTWVSASDFLSGWVKAFVFGSLIAGIGCMKGLATRNDATAVGESTTSAVVAAIIMIVVVDGIFAMLYFKLDV